MMSRETSAQLSPLQHPASSRSQRLDLVTQDALSPRIACGNPAILLAPPTTYDIASPHTKKSSCVTSGQPSHPAPNSHATIARSQRTTSPHILGFLNSWIPEFLSPDILKA